MAGPSAWGSRQCTASSTPIPAIRDKPRSVYVSRMVSVGDVERPGDCGAPAPGICFTPLYADE